MKNSRAHFLLVLLLSVVSNHVTYQSSASQQQPNQRIVNGAASNVTSRVKRTSSTPFLIEYLKDQPGCRPPRKLQQGLDRCTKYYHCAGVVAGPIRIVEKVCKKDISGDCVPKYQHFVLPGGKKVWQTIACYSPASTESANGLCGRQKPLYCKE